MVPFWNPIVNLEYFYKVVIIHVIVILTGMGGCQN